MKAFVAVLILVAFLSNGLHADTSASNVGTDTKIENKALDESNEDDNSAPKETHGAPPPMKTKKKQRRIKEVLFHLMKQRNRLTLHQLKQIKIILIRKRL